MNKKILKDSFCNYCGADISEIKTYPKFCRCDNIIYINPRPVTVAIIPIIQGGYVLIRRNIEPAKGKLAFPGGFVEVTETWQDGLIREVKEETGITVKTVTLFDVKTSILKDILIFGKTEPVSLNQIDLKFSNEETQEITISGNSDEIVWETHKSTYINLLKS